MTIPSAHSNYDDDLFRLQFPEFSNTTSYPESVISLYWDIAQSFTQLDGSPCYTINGDCYMVTMNYLTAHVMTVSRPNPPAGAGGGSVPSGGGGFTTGATVGEVTVNKLAPPAADGWEWWLASTPYGQALWALLSLKSVGGFSVGGLPEREGFRKIGGIFW